MSIRSKDDVRVFRTQAHLMYFSNTTIDAFLDSASAAQLHAVSDFIELEIENRQIAKHTRLMHKAKFDEIKSFDDFDFSNVTFPDGYTSKDMRSLAFIDAKQDFVFYGPTGRGKTHCCEALGLEAIDAGYEVRFFTVANLVMQLQRFKVDGKLLGFLDGLKNAKMIILDEFGYVPIDIEGSRLLFQVMTECLKNCSLVITTNIEFGKWGAVLGDDKMAAAIVDRLVEHGRLVEFGGASHRMEHALMLGKQGGVQG